VAPFPAKEKTYKQRSPILHKDKLVTPIIFFQGGQDKIVSPAQAKKLYDVLQTKKIRSELVIYPNEGHGFRSAKIIASSIAQELAFYQEFF
jgi:dipeptidyl aminopeptidase/acylaminoacyl peptidase